MPSTLLIATAGAFAIAAVASPQHQSVPQSLGTKANRICALNYQRTKEFSRQNFDASTNERAALWHKGISVFLDGTGKDLRRLGVLPLGASFRTFATAYRGAAVAYLSGSLAKVNLATANVHSKGTATMRAAGAINANVCVRYAKDYR